MERTVQRDDCIVAVRSLRETVLLGNLDRALNGGRAVVRKENSVHAADLTQAISQLSLGGG